MGDKLISLERLGDFYNKLKEKFAQSDWNETDTSSFAYIKNKPTEATTTTTGFMSATDKSKLDGVAEGAEVNVNADWNATEGDAQILNKPLVYNEVTQATQPTSQVTGDYWNEIYE